MIAKYCVALMVQTLLIKRNKLYPIAVLALSPDMTNVPCE